MPGLPKAGHSQSLKGLDFDFAGLAADGIDGVRAGKALSGMPQQDQLATRGGAEADIYRRFSPSVVMVITKEGLGSGSIVSPDGLVLTSLHVVAGYSRVGVVLKPAAEGAKPTDSDVVTADVIKIDQVADLALLKMSRPAVGRVPITFGDFTKVNVGDDVHAIGHPTGEAWTYTKGYVSQIRRDYKWQAEDGVQHVADVIQTQTPINPGNSGGPLLNSAGLIIGINAFKDQGEGLNFAVGSDAIQAFIARKGNRVAASVAKVADTCKAHVLFEGRTADDTGAMRQVDTECHGNPDLTFVLPDDKSKPAYVVVTTSESGNPDGIIYSFNRDGKWNISYWDSKGAGKFDTVGYHPDGKIAPSSYGPYVEK